MYLSEAAAALYDKQPGQLIRLPIGRAPGDHSEARVLGIWRDYARQFGAIAIDTAAYQALTGDTRINDLALWLAPGADAQQVRQRLRALGGDADLLDIAATPELRALSLAIFDRSFAVTTYLQAVAIAIGLVGIAASLSAQVLARRKEFGLLAHLGLTRAQVIGVVAGEAAAWLAAGVLLGLALGLAVSVVLVHVVNPQSFHWTMQLLLPWGELLTLCAAWCWPNARAGRRRQPARAAAGRGAGRGRAALAGRRPGRRLLSRHRAGAALGRRRGAGLPAAGHGLGAGRRLDAGAPRRGAVAGAGAEGPGRCLAHARPRLARPGAAGPGRGAGLRAAAGRPAAGRLPVGGGAAVRRRGAGAGGGAGACWRCCRRRAHALPLLAMQRARFQRHTASAAVAGVVASLALSVALTVMVTSFRGGVAAWLDQVLPADLYARSAGSSAAADQAWLDPAFVAAVRALPGVQRVMASRVRALQLAPERPAVVLLARPLAQPGAGPAAAGRAAAAACRARPACT